MPESGRGRIHNASIMTERRLSGVCFLKCLCGVGRMAALVLTEADLIRVGVSEGQCLAFHTSEKESTESNNSCVNIFRR